MRLTFALEGLTPLFEVTGLHKLRAVLPRQFALGVPTQAFRFHPEAEPRFYSFRASSSQVGSNPLRPISNFRSWSDMVNQPPMQGFRSMKQASRQSQLKGTSRPQRRLHRTVHQERP